MNKSGDDILHIVDGDYEIGCKNEKVAYWSTFSSKENSISLPAMVEREKESLKKEFFTWLTNFSQSKIKQKTLVEALKVEGDFSFWWPSLLNEKSAYKSPWIYDMFRVRLLRRIFNDGDYGSVCVHTSNLKLSKLIRQFAREHNVKFSFKKYHNKNIDRPLYDLRRVVSGMPSIGRAALFLCRFLWSNRVFIFNKHSSRQLLAAPSKKQISIVSYFPNMDLEKASNGQFYSNYWANLPAELMDDKFIIHWSFIYGKNPACSTKQALEFCSQFNESYPDQSFTFLHEYLSFKVFFRALKLYFKLCMRYMSVRKVMRPMFSPADPNVDFYLLKRDLSDSIIGKTAMENCLFYALFERSVAGQQKSAACVYLMENQGWEKCLVYNWRKINHRPIIGYSHSSIRCFDLRYFGFEYELNFAGNKTMPTKVACCGKDSIDKLTDLDVPQSYFLGLEAIRYTYLNRFKSTNQSFVIKNKQISILCLTDIKAKSAVYQLKFLSEFVVKYQAELNVNIVVKPHPFLPNAKALVERCLSNIKHTITTEHLSKMNLAVDVALVDSDTTAAIDVAYMGIPFLSLRNPGVLNLSPVLNHSNFFIESIEDFYNKLCNIEGSKAYLNDVFHGNNEFFYLDENLPRWERLLASI